MHLETNLVLSIWNIVPFLIAVYTKWRPPSIKHKVRWSSAVIQLISREGTGMMFADISPYADLLCGVHYQDENVYVIGHRHVPKTYFVLKLHMNGEVE